MWRTTRDIYQWSIDALGLQNLTHAATLGGVGACSRNSPESSTTAQSNHCQGILRQCLHPRLHSHWLTILFASHPMNSAFSGRYSAFHNQNITFLFLLCGVHHNLNCRRSGPRHYSGMKPQVYVTAREHFIN